MGKIKWSLRDFFGLVIAISIPQLAGGIGALFTVSAISTWYAQLTKPPFNPPSWIFGPVWTILFVFMGIAAFLVWREGGKIHEGKIALFFFLFQLGLNVLWSIIFFGMHNPGGAFLEIIFLWLAIIITLITFLKISKPAAWLLVPYLLWVGFAAYLNYAIWMLN